MSARDRFDRALVDMAARGEKPRCAWPDIGPWFTSDDPDERARAARRCHGCDVFELCGAAADEQKDVWTVRAGIDRRPSRQARRAIKESTTR